MANVLVVAESRGGELRKVAFEAVSAGRALADAQGGEVHALSFGPPGLAAKIDQLGRFGADLAVAVEHPALANHNPESVSRTVTERARGGYGAVLLSASAQGRDLAPRIAAQLGVPMASDVVAIEAAGDALVLRHPMFANKLIATLRLTARPAVVSIRPGAFPARETSRASRVETMPPAVDPGASRVVVKETVAGRSAKLDLGDAPIIVSGGRGLRAAENFKLIEELAEALGNAAVGCTRAVTDDGWRPHSDQIGQTGRTVSPELYVAVGISGAIQHLAGIRNSKTIVAINKDRDAPIFGVADYGIVGDVLEVVPALTAAVREARKGH